MVGKVRTPSALNEGRSVNPGDTGSTGLPARRRRPLNEGRSVNPGDTCGVSYWSCVQPSAQRRPERQPRRHPSSEPEPDADHRRSTKAGASTPATPGRGPAGRPRQPRSTKAGASTPATPDLRELLVDLVDSAQRRPERQPRRHKRRWIGNTPEPTTLNEGRSVNPGDTCREANPNRNQCLRSTKAGASTPATPGTGWCRNAPRASPLNEGRSVNPGDTAGTDAVFSDVGTDAQRRPERQPRRHCPPASCTTSLTPALNEGRSVNPGDTAAFRAGVLIETRRSTKAGASTPATRATIGASGARQKTLNEGRSVNPGDTRRSCSAAALTATNAQRRPERQPRRHQKIVRQHDGVTPLNEGRSVNPGDTGPRCAAPGLPAALNEGRSVNPGDTRCLPWATTSRLRALNEGRSVNPGDTAYVALMSAALGYRSTKAGASTPATRLNRAKGWYRDQPSLVHGRGSLGDDAFAAISRDFGRYPARMVRIKQSRLP